MTVMQHRMGYAAIAAAITVNVILCYNFGWYTILCAVWYSFFAVVYTMGSKTFKSLIPYAYMSYALALLANSWYVKSLPWGTVLTVLMIGIAYLSIQLVAQWINKTDTEEEKHERA